MGKFANSLPSGPQWIGDGPVKQKEPWHGQSGYDAYGHEVPAFRKAAGYQAMKDMGFTDREQMLSIVGGMAERIARDDPHMALENALKAGLDVTGCYRLLATLLAAPEPKPQPEPEASFLDLVQ